MDETSAALAPSRLVEPLLWGDPLERDALVDETFVLPAGTVTLLLADIQGSVALWETHGDMPERVRQFERLVNRCVRRHQGVCPVEQGEGDSFVAAFARPSDALAAIVELQRALLSELPEIRLRAALHAGEVRIHDGRTYVGRTINRCARLRDAAHGGQTLISGTCHDLVADSLPPDVTVRDLGLHRLRDLARAERVYQVCHPELPVDFPPLRSLERTPNNLPTMLTSFVGRRRELADVAELLRANRLVTLTGSGGCGKTRLAVQAAASVDDARDGVWFVDLSPVSDADAVAPRVAAALDIEPRAGHTAIDLLVQSIGDRKLLLVLDNCEHLVGGCADVVEALLRQCHQVSVLATSRTRLGVDGESTYRVPSLSLPSASSLSTVVDALETSEAVELFVDRARKARPNFTMNDSNARYVADIVCRLDGIPLAIELAAARARVLSPKQIAAGLQHRFRVLTGGSRTAMPRQQTLRASVDWSHALLDDREQRLFRRVSVFAGGFTLDAAEAVGGGDGLDPYEILDLLTALVDKSLLTADEALDDVRYGMLETIRQCAEERLTEEGEEEGLKERHLRFFVGGTQPFATPGSKEGDEVVVRLADEADNVLRALRWGFDHRPVDAVQLLVGVAPLLAIVWRLGSETVTLAERGVAVVAAYDVNDTVRGAALSFSALAHSYRDPMLAAKRAGEAIAIAREIGVDSLAAWPLAILGYTKFLSGTDEIASLFEECIAISDREGIGGCGAFARAFYGLALVMAGERERGREMLERSVSAMVGSGVGLEERRPRLVTRPLELTARTHLAFARFGSDVDAAAVALEDIVDKAREGHMPEEEVTALYFLAWARLYAGDADSARVALDAIEASATRVRSGGGLSVAFLAAPVPRALVLLADGHNERALAVLTSVLPQTQALGHVVVAAMNLVTQAEVALAEGDPHEARAHVQEALALLDVRFAAAYVPDTLEVLARAARAEGRLGEAEDVAHQALELAAASARPILVDLLEDLAGLAALQESFQEAARLFGAAAAVTRLTGYSSYPHRRAFIESGIARVRDALGEEGFAKAQAEGEALSQAEAVAYARRGRGERRRPSTGWASLTPTEERVVALVQEGLTNRQIAERLFVSPATARTHLANIFRKLGVSSRAALASVATRREA